MYRKPKTAIEVIDITFQIMTHLGNMITAEEAIHMEYAANIFEFDDGDKVVTWDPDEVEKILNIKISNFERADGETYVDDNDCIQISAKGIAEYV